MKYFVIFLILTGFAGVAFAEHNGDDLHPEPEQPFIPAKCGEGTTLQDGICVANEIDVNAGSSSKWEQYLHRQNIPPPLKQMQLGIKLGHIICDEDKIPTWNVHYKPACVFPETESKLLTRGWAKLRLMLPTSGDPIKELEWTGQNEVTYRILGNLRVGDQPPPSTLDEKRKIAWEYAQKYHPDERFLEYSIPTSHMYHFNVGEKIQFEIMEWGNYFECWDLGVRIFDAQNKVLYEDTLNKSCLEPDGKPGWFSSYSVGKDSEITCEKPGYYMIQVSNGEIFPPKILQNFACLAHESEPEITKQSFANQIFLSCGGDDDCTIRYLQQFSQINGRQPVLDTIDELITVYDNSEIYCHPNAHHVGEFLLGYVNGNLTEAAKYIDSRCASGVLHGITENTIGIQNLLHHESKENVDIITPCNEIEKHLGPNAKMECVHGMGHSIAKAYNYDVIEAVKKCDQFETELERFMCQGGMFMENLNQYWDYGKGAFDENDLLYPCNQIDEKHASLCYRYHGTYFLIQNDFEPSAAFENCEEISNQVFVEYCYRGVSSYMANKYSQNIDKTIDMCESANKNYQALCVQGAIESITRFVSDDLGDDFCEKLSPDFQNNCYKRMNELIDSRF